MEYMKTERLLAIFFILSLIFLFATPTTRAQTTGDSSVNVNISNSTGGNSISIQNETSASVNTSSDTDSNSHVRVEQNGEVTEFNSTGETVDYVSENGTVKININGNTHPSPTSTPVPVSDEDAEEILGEKDEKTVEEHRPSPAKSTSMSLENPDDEISSHNAIISLLLSVPNPFSVPIEVITLLGLVYDSN